MTGFDRNPGNEARLGGISIADILAQAGVPTPAYVYDLGGIREAAQNMVDALGEGRHVVAYAVKANSAGSVIRTILEAGGGAEVVSLGELEVALSAGVSPSRILTTAVAKTGAAIDRAIQAGVRRVQR